jgi:hypothetical protein
LQRSNSRRQIVTGCSGFAPKRQNSAPTSSIIMNIAGTNTSESEMKNTRSPIRDVDKLVG